MVCNLFIIVVSKLIPQRAPEHRHFDVQRIPLYSLAKLKFHLFLLHHFLSTFTVYEISFFCNKKGVGKWNIFNPFIIFLFILFLSVLILESCQFLCRSIYETLKILLANEFPLRHDHTRRSRVVEWLISRTLQLEENHTACENSTVANKTKQKIEGKLSILPSAKWCTCQASIRQKEEDRRRANSHDVDKVGRSGNGEVGP